MDEHRVEGTPDGPADPGTGVQTPADPAATPPTESGPIAPGSAAPTSIDPSSAATSVAPSTVTPVTPATRGRGWRTTFGVGLALVLAFAWGALAYRELSPVRQFATAPIAVAGVQAPPGWISDFVKAFCNADAAHLATRMGPPLAGQTEAIAQALTTREWSCSTTRFLGGGTNSKGQFYVWLTIDDEQDEQWWVFTVVDDKVIAIE